MSRLARVGVPILAAVTVLTGCGSSVQSGAPSPSLATTTAPSETSVPGTDPSSDPKTAATQACQKFRQIAPVLTQAVVEQNLSIAIRAEVGRPDPANKTSNAPANGSSPYPAMQRDASEAAYDDPIWNPLNDKMAALDRSIYDGDPFAQSTFDAVRQATVEVSRYCSTHFPSTS